MCVEAALARSLSNNPTWLGSPLVSDSTGCLIARGALPQRTEEKVIYGMPKGHLWRRILHWCRAIDLKRRNFWMRVLLMTSSMSEKPQRGRRNVCGMPLVSIRRHLWKKRHL
jgi:hypothetical protein